MTQASKTALISGITGQDGSYLAEALLSKGYQVVGMVSAKNDIGDQNIAHIKEQLILDEGDLLDEDSIKNLIIKYKPDEFYNLGGISFVPASWDNPALNFDVNALGVLRILESIRDISPTTKLFQATSAKIFAEDTPKLQDENTSYGPQDPYSVAKLNAHLAVGLFRNHFQIYACSGILFNHESPRRGLNFVTKKITQGAVKIKLGLEKELKLGNLDAVQDWGYAPDYIEGMWLMLQQDKADDYVLATGQLHTVKEICQIAFSTLGLNWQDYVISDQQFFRALSKHPHCGNPKKAETILGWTRKLGFEEMIKQMVQYDLDLLRH